MRHIIPLAIALPLLALVIPACDSPDDEAELQALDIENDGEVQTLDAVVEVQEANLDLAINTPDPLAAELGQLCRTNSNGNTILYTSPNSGIWVPPNSLVRILDWRGPYHYLARYSGTVGQLARSVVVQSSCYWQ